MRCPLRLSHMLPIHDSLSKLFRIISMILVNVAELCRRGFLHFYERSGLTINLPLTYGHFNISVAH